jgi:hypothetical protein
MFKNKWIRVLGLFVFGAFISLVSMGGCGDDDGEGDDGGLGSFACSRCTCEYFAVALSLDCWPDAIDFVAEHGVEGNCVIISRWQGNPDGVAALKSGPAGCAVFTDAASLPPECNAEPQEDGPRDTAACNECLEQYANDLNGVHPVSGQPFICTPSQ